MVTGVEGAMMGDDWGKRVEGEEEGGVAVEGGRSKPCCLMPGCEAMRGGCRPPREVTTRFPP